LRGDPSGRYKWSDKTHLQQSLAFIEALQEFYGLDQIEDENEKMEYASIMVILLHHTKGKPTFDWQ